MATIAKKRILEVEDERGEEDCKKRRRVQFDDKVEIIINQGSKSPELLSSANGEYKQEEVDWLLQLVNDVELDNNTSSAGEEQKAVEEVHHKESCNMSPSSSTQCYDDIKEEPLLRVSSTNNIVEDTLKVSIACCNEPTPLITPPSSPRRIRTLSVDGLMEEEATVCEWPFNLTVDNALMAASSFSGDESSGDTK